MFPSYTQVNIKHELSDDESCIPQAKIKRERDCDDECCIPPAKIKYERHSGDQSYIPQAKLKLERDRNGDGESSSSQLECQQSNASNTHNQPMKISDLDDICMEKIFDHLDVISLLNVANANGRMRPAARQIFKRRFGHMPSLITGRTWCTETIIANFNSVDVHGLRDCLQYLRCFGPSISDLWILGGKWTAQQCKYIHRYINKYCAHSLLTISFQDMTYIPLKQFIKPFAIVQEVHMFDVDLGNQLASLPKWFPNASSLKLHSTRINKRCVDVPFQHLKHLYLDISQSDGHGLSVNQATHLVSSNNRLDSLHLFVYGHQRLTPFTLLNMINNNRAITKLMVTMYESTTIVHTTHMDRLVSEHSLLVELTLRGFKFSSASALALIGRLKFLTSFCFDIKDADVSYNHFVHQLGQDWTSSRNGNSVTLHVRQD